MDTMQRPNPNTHYDRVTDGWRYLLGDDLHYGFFSSPDLTLHAATHALTELVAAKAALQKGMSICDIGCGTGTPAIYLAREHGCRVLGISTSSIGLERATARADAAGVSGKVRFEVRDGMATGLEAHSFDRVWVMESSHLMPRKNLLLKECGRLLRRGGRLVLCDIVLLREIPFPELLSIREDLLVLDAVFARAKMQQLSTYASMAEEAGMKVITQMDISRETLPTLAHWRANADTYASEVEELLGRQGLEEFRRACDVLSRFWLDRLGYGLLVADVR
jgi:27-O-demethylrifamycin SV methyltransferase